MVNSQLKPMTRHAPKCERPGWVWHEQLRTDLPCIGRCTGCGAITKAMPLQTSNDQEQNQ